MEAREIVDNYSYHHIKELMEGLEKLDQKKKIEEKLMLIEVLAQFQSAKNKKTRSSYIRWKRGLENRHEELSKESEEISVWDKLKVPIKRNKDSEVTIWDRIRFRSKK